MTINLHLNNLIIHFINLKDKQLSYNLAHTFYRITIENLLPTHPYLKTNMHTSLTQVYTEDIYLINSYWFTFVLINSISYDMNSILT